MPPGQWGVISVTAGDPIHCPAQSRGEALQPTPGGSTGAHCQSKSGPASGGSATLPSLHPPQCQMSQVSGEQVSASGQVSQGDLLASLQASRPPPLV